MRKVICYIFLTLFVLLVAGCSKSWPVVNVDLIPDTDQDRIILQIANNDAEKSINIVSFAVTDDTTGAIALSSNNYEGWFPLAVPAGGRWEFYFTEKDHNKAYTATVTISYEGRNKVITARL